MAPAPTAGFPLPADPAELAAADDGPDPLSFELGYEAADPLLQAQLWGDTALALRS